MPKVINVSADVTGKPTFDIPKPVAKNLDTAQHTLVVMGSILPGDLGNTARTLASGLAGFLRGLEAGGMPEVEEQPE